MPQIEIVSTLSGLQGLKDRWIELEKRSTTSSVFQLWEWSEAWARTYGRALQKRSSLRIITAVEGDRLLGVLPLHLEQSRRVRLLRWVGSSERASADFYPEYGDIICSSSEREELIPLFRRALGSVQADCFWFEVVKEGSSLPRILPSGLSKPVGERHYEADLSAGFESLLERCSSNTRSRFRRIFRKSEEIGLQFSAAEGVQAKQEALDELAELHQVSWRARGETGAFHRSIKRRFHHALIADERPGFQSRLFSLREKNGDPLALLYGFQVGSRFEFFQSGIDYGKASQLPSVMKSIGITAHLHAMKYCSENGVESYDFMGGDSSYKDQLATESHSASSVRMYRPTVRNGMYLLQKSGRAIKRRLFSQ